MCQEKPRISLTYLNLYFVWVEFTDEFCFVKDRVTKLVFVPRVIKEGLCPLVFHSAVQVPGQS